jgi:Rhodopirellula transposase DDE domain
LANLTGFDPHISHFPQRTSKWNKIEHRMFSFITQNWRARPLVSYQTIIDLIAKTRTTTGLKIKARLT